MKKGNQKGFTLVEVIVVLVVLAILIAIAVPSVMKYIDDAKDAQIMAQAKGAVQEAELTSIEYLAKKTAVTWKEFDELVDDELQKSGYQEAVFGNSLGSNLPVITDEWGVFSIYYEVKDDDGMLDERGNINYQKNPKIIKYQITIAKTGSARTYEYIPNESFRLVSSYDS